MNLHLGCGKRNFEGWVNVDIADFPHIHHRTSVNDLSMFDNDTADIIYSSHTLEYFDRAEVLDVLVEWRRVLKPNGIVRIAVPNFDALIDVYKATGSLENILGPLYGRMDVGAENASEFIYHKTCYNFDNLKEILENIGFINVRNYDWRDTSHSQYDDHSQAYFPHMDKDNGLLVSLNVEANKSE